MFKQQGNSHIFRIIITSFTILVSQCGFNQPAQAAIGTYCKFDQEEVLKKEQLLQGLLEGNVQAQQEYKELIAQHAQLLNQCRRQTWPQTQAIWLRLYPCDVSPGSIDYILDRIVNLGYNRIHLEVFYDSQVLLPPGDNPTPWIPVVRSPGAENVDLLEQTIKKGHERGLKVYAWLFTMNFGYTYAQQSDRQDALARNAQGENSLAVVHDRSQAFIDPYNRQAQVDYYQLIQAVLAREPDGVLFDYIRYPRGTGARSTVGRVQDLWIYAPASLQALYNRAKNKKGQALIERYITKGKISLDDLVSLDYLYPDEGVPDWQGRQISASETKESARSRLGQIQSELWFFSVAHAAQGIIDFLSFAASPVQRRNLPAGAIFFPDGNRLVGRGGFDSRLQAWDKFPASLEWHPMAYSICDDASCVVNEINTVRQMASPQTKIIPALAGAWGQTYKEHPSLEIQMSALHSAFPDIDSVSHFAYSWIEPQIDRQRQVCKLQ